MDQKNIVKLDEVRKKKHSATKKALTSSKFSFWHWLQFFTLLAIISLMLKKCSI